MYDVIISSLQRQEKGLELLQELLRIEYKTICERKMTLVSHQEFSIQELIRQLVEEKDLVIRLLQGVPLREYAKGLPEDLQTPLFEKMEVLDKREQETSRQAGRNSQLVLALLDQNSKSMKTLFKEAVPEVALVYGRRGAMNPIPTQGALISGRL